MITIVLVFLESTELLLEYIVLYLLLSIVLHLLNLVITQYADQVSCIPLSQLIKGISRVLGKLLKHLNVTVVSASYILRATWGLLLLAL